MHQTLSARYSSLEGERILLQNSKFKLSRFVGNSRTPLLSREIRRHPILLDTGYNLQRLHAWIDQGQAPIITTKELPFDKQSATEEEQKQSVSPEPISERLVVEQSARSSTAATSEGFIEKNTLQYLQFVAAVILMVLAAKASGHMWSDLWASYCVALAEKPLLTKCITGLIAGFISDVMAQFFAHVAHAHSTPKSADGSISKVTIFRLDMVRCLRLMLYGALVGTPIVHYWYQYLDATIMPDSPTSLAAVLIKMTADQGLAAPILTAFFFSVLRCMEGRPHDIPHTLKSSYWPTLRANYCLWPAAHVINFMFIPSSQRILYVSVVGIFWSAFLNYMLSRSVSQLQETPPSADHQMVEVLPSPVKVAPETVEIHSEVGSPRHERRSSSLKDLNLLDDEHIEPRHN